MERITKDQYRILIVDDDLLNLEILRICLGGEGYDAVSVDRAEDAWELLQSSPQSFDVILLDRRMPGGDGLELLHRIKAHPLLLHIPVIFQTARGAKEDILEGLRAGAYYYLTKPFEHEQLMAIVKTAVSDFVFYKKLLNEAEKTMNALSLMKNGAFLFSGLDDCYNVAILLSKLPPVQDPILIGLAELFINAVEHGNLGISYQEKTDLIKAGQWTREIQRRLELPEFQHKVVEVSFERTSEKIEFTIQDEGKGFDWESFMEIDPARLFDTHGRGIAIANTQCFDGLQYYGCGNKVVATLKINK